jgi:hypothetical protein
VKGIARGTALALLLVGCATSPRPAEDAESSVMPPAEVQPPGDEQPSMEEIGEPLEEAPPAPTPPEEEHNLGAERPTEATSTPELEEREEAEYLAELPEALLIDPCAQETAEDAPMLDETRRLLEETLCGAALWVDSLFGEPGDIAAARKVHGHIELSGNYSQFEGTKVRLRVDVRAELPTLKNRLNAFIGRDNENDFLRDRSEGFALRSQFPRLDDEEGWLGGLGYGLPETDRLRSEFRVGVHGLNPPKAFVQWRTRYNIYSDVNDVYYLRATPFWNSKDGFGLTTNFDMSHVLSPTRLIRLSTAATRSEATAGIDWRNAVIVYQNLRQGRAVALEGFVRGSTQAPEPLGEYGVRAVYRQPIVRDKLFVEAILGYGWPRVDPLLPREGSVGTGLSIDMPFGKKI